MDNKKAQIIRDMEARMAKIIERHSDAPIEQTIQPIPHKPPTPKQSDPVVNKLLEPVKPYVPAVTVEVPVVQPRQQDWQNEEVEPAPKAPVNYRAVIGWIVLALVLVGAVVEMWFVLS
ncbi:hypothetical protein [Dyadobacter psychrotolerans]|uniref:Uncharacterized protein n=1 Tax=Dyadobacter psychrotolerans TaxID=2541721 RepID=A0A4R5DZQ8_9BACT|nr:hypothetical protein [Dyadobacter psychrotolerans]TDE17691.1 hypothetical protein E0F88_07315 [Dyadobacter psychrotolerans]